MIKELNIQIDHTELTELFHKAWNSQAWSKSFPTVQSGLNVSADNPDDYLSSCGGGLSTEKEKSFCLFHKFYKNSYVQKLDESLNLNIYRWRWMILFGKSCYSLHQDSTQRVHIPIISNPQSFLIFKDPAALFELSVGKTYLVDTRKTHSAMNGHETWRVHLVGCIDDNSL
jgi:hypothetical protein